MSMISLPYYEILLRLGLSTLCAIVFGAERYRRKKPVGVRTNILVALAACQTAIISGYGFIGSSVAYSGDIIVTSDPARLVVGILGGVGFIGAGIIYKSPAGTIRGITTATQVFLIAVIGIGFGLGLYSLSMTTAIIAFFTIQSSMLRNLFFKKNK
ncbi:MAG: MgtC/SapB family protein [Synergistaceae bacterium]|nr:MgtC/SapB family protein [Synergistaceae bacterium]